MTVAEHKRTIKPIKVRRTRYGRMLERQGIIDNASDCLECHFDTPVRIEIYRTSDIRCTTGVIAADVLTTGEPNMTEENKPNPRKLLVLIGPYLGDKDKIGASFALATNEQLQAGRLGEDIGEAQHYGSKAMMDRVGTFNRPGTVYSVEYDANNPGTIYPSTMNYAGFLENDPRKVEWQAQASLFRAELELKKREKKNAGRNAMKEALAPVKIAYNNLIGRNRALYLAEAVAYITGRVTKEDEKMAGYEEDDES
jgi:hypothetical protein